MVGVDELNTTTVAIPTWAVQVGSAGWCAVVGCTAGNFVIDEANCVGTTIAWKRPTALAKYRLSRVRCAGAIQRASFTVVAVR